MADYVWQIRVSFRGTRGTKREDGQSCDWLFVLGRVVGMGLVSKRGRVESKIGDMESKINDWKVFLGKWKERGSFRGNRGTKREDCQSCDWLFGLGRVVGMGLVSKRGRVESKIGDMESKINDWKVFLGKWKERDSF